MSLPMKLSVKSTMADCCWADGRSIISSLMSPSISFYCFLRVSLPPDAFRLQVFLAVLSDVLYMGVDPSAVSYIYKSQFIEICMRQVPAKFKRQG